MSDTNPRGSLKSKDTLKSFFENGDIPTEDHFADLIESFSHLSDPKNIKSIERTLGGILITLGDDTTVEIKAKPDLAADSEKLGGVLANKYVRKDKNEDNSFVNNFLIFNHTSETDVDAISFDPASSAFYFNTGRGKNRTSANAHINANNIGAAGAIYANNGFFDDGKRLATQDYVNGRGFLTGVNWPDIGSKPNLIGAKMQSSHWGTVLPGGSDKEWLRTTVSGIIPYKSGGYSRLGTPNWSFLEVHSKAYFENGAKLSDRYLGKTAQATSAANADKLDGNDSSAFLLRSGGTMTGDLVMTNRKIRWSENSDHAEMGFKNDGDADANSYMYFKTGDNNNEYFRWEHRSGNTTHEWMSLKADGLRVIGRIYSYDISAAGTISATQGFFDNKKRVATQEYVNSKVSTDLTWAKLSGKPTLPRAKEINGYWGLLLPDGTDQRWYRTTKDGIIPYTAGGASRVGTRAWPFNEMNSKVYYENGETLSSKYLGKTAKAASAANADKLNDKDSSEFLLRSGGTMTGSLNMTNQEIIWSENTDAARIGFYNVAGQDESYMYFKTQDNGNEYFRWLHKDYRESSDQEWMRLKPSGLTVKGNIYADGTSYFGAGKKIIDFADTWIRLNPTSAFAAGIYCGNKVLRTDGQFEVGEFGLKFKVTSAGTVTAAGSITSAGDITAFSDRALKTNIQPINDGFLAKINQLQPSSYQWKDESKSQRTQMGFIAQDVKELFPEWVHENDEHLSLAYDKMGAVLAVKGIQELHAEIAELKETIKELQNGVTK